MVPLLVTLAFASLPPGVRPHHPPDPQTAELVRLVRDRNRAAIASIRTLSCQFSEQSIDWPSPGTAAAASPLLEIGRYWRDGSTVRLRQTSRIFPPPAGESTTVTDQLIRGGKCWILSTYPGVQGPRATLSAYPSESASVRGVWRYCLFAHFGPKDTSFRKYGDLTFDEMLAGPYEVVRAGRVTEEGRDCVHVELASIQGRHGFWFAPEFNYLVWKTATTAKAGGWRSEQRVIEFVRSEDGACLPVQIQVLHYSRGKLSAAARRALSDVRINKPLAPGDLRLPNIAGMTCTDYVRVSEYPVDADGNPAGPETPGRKEGNAVTFGLERPTYPDPPQSAEESLPDLGPPPRGREWPVGVALLGAFLVIVVVASYAGRRPRRTT
jgi:hypothetical protein